MSSYPILMVDSSFCEAWPTIYIHIKIFLIICLFSTKVTKTFFDEKIKNSVEFSKKVFSNILNFRGKQTNYQNFF